MEAEIRTLITKINRIEKAMYRQPGDWVTVNEMCESMKIDRKTFDRDYAPRMKFLFRPREGANYKASVRDFEQFKEDVKTGRVVL